MAPGGAAAVAAAAQSIADELRTQVAGPGQAAAHVGITAEFIVADGNPFTELTRIAGQGRRAGRHRRIRVAGHPACRVAGGRLVRHGALARHRRPLAALPNADHRRVREHLRKRRPSPRASGAAPSSDRSPGWAALPVSPSANSTALRRMRAGCFQDRAPPAWFPCLAELLRGRAGR